MQRGYSATSIDDVARRLGATKGRIYHYYPSKTDLFLDVYRMGMQLNFEAVGKICNSRMNPADRLRAMCRAHVMTMMEEQAFQRTVWEGMNLHGNTATTPDQKVALEQLLAMREDYDQLFRSVMEECVECGELDYGKQSIAVSTLFSAMLGPIFWYTPGSGETGKHRYEIADQVVRFVMRGLGYNKGTDAWVK